MTPNQVKSAERRTLTGKRQLSRLYTEDEIAWLEIMADLVRRRQFGQLDYKNLSEYLTDMALSEKREVLSRLAVLIAHRLNWKFQPRKRSRGWALTILEQQEMLEFDFDESRLLRNYAEENLARVYAKAVRRATRETGLDKSKFPDECPYTLDDLLSEEWEKQND
jgi:hypothetical protein